MLLDPVSFSSESPLRPIDQAEFAAALESATGSLKLFAIPAAASVSSSTMSDALSASLTASSLASSMASSLSSGFSSVADIQQSAVVNSQRSDIIAVSPCASAFLVGGGASSVVSLQEDSDCDLLSSPPLGSEQLKQNSSSWASASAEVVAPPPEIKLDDDGRDDSDADPLLAGSDSDSEWEVIDGDQPGASSAAVGAAAAAVGVKATAETGIAVAVVATEPSEVRDSTALGVASAVEAPVTLAVVPAVAATAAEVKADKPEEPRVAIALPLLDASSVVGKMCSPPVSPLPVGSLLPLPSSLLIASLPRPVAENDEKYAAADIKPLASTILSLSAPFASAAVDAVEKSSFQNDKEEAAASVAALRHSVETSAMAVVDAPSPAALPPAELIPAVEFDDDDEKYGSDDHSSIAAHHAPERRDAADIDAADQAAIDAVMAGSWIRQGRKATDPDEADKIAIRAALEASVVSLPAPQSESSAALPAAVVAPLPCAASESASELSEADLAAIHAAMEASIIMPAASAPAAPAAALVAPPPRPVPWNAELISMVGLPFAATAEPGEVCQGTTCLTCNLRITFAFTDFSSEACLTLLLSTVAEIHRHCSPAQRGHCAMGRGASVTPTLGRRFVCARWRRRRCAVPTRSRSRRAPAAPAAEPR
jgi:hypothetical protein